VAERKNWHPTQMNRSMLHAENVPLCFWAKCMKTSVYVISALP